MVDDFQKHLGTLAMVALFTVPGRLRGHQIMRPHFLERRSESMCDLTYHQRLRRAKRRVLRVAGLFR